MGTTAWMGENVEKGGTSMPSKCQGRKEGREMESVHRGFQGIAVDHGVFPYCRGDWLSV